MPGVGPGTPMTRRTVMRNIKCLCVLAGILLTCRFTQVGATDGVKIAFIDPLSGTFANVGEVEVRSYQYAIDRLNARGGVLGGSKLELVTFDNKANPQDALLALKQAIDQGIRFVTQGNSSAVTLALSDAIARHNAQDPNHSVILLNYGSNDPALTNERCNFWHFRFDADADMRMSALTDTITANKNVKRVYLINQDYSAGHAVAKAARVMLAQKRPDISIVGDDFHPFGQLKDFSPYVAMIKASGADSVITQNWGNDLALLVKATMDAGLNLDYYTYYASGAGTLTVVGERALGHIKEVSAYDQNPSDERAVKYIAQGLDTRPGVVIDMLAQAIERAHTTDSPTVARALEGMTYDYFYGPVQMRADNHQLIQPLFIHSVAKVDGGAVKFERDHSGMGWKVERRIEGKDTIMPTTCKMERPQ
jgi:branched-chain amino acid transport system substrate-binding protein